LLHRTKSCMVNTVGHTGRGTDGARKRGEREKMNGKTKKKKVLKTTKRTQSLNRGKKAHDPTQTGGDLKRLAGFVVKNQVWG